MTRGVRILQTNACAHKLAYLFSSLFTNHVNDLQDIVGYYKFRCIQRVLKICTILKSPLETYFK